MNLVRVRAVIDRQLYVARRAPHRWFDAAVWPVVDTVIWGSIGLYVEQQGGAARSTVPYMIAGVLLLHVVYQANVSMATGFLEETWTRNLLNMMVTPLKEAEFLAGLVSVSLLRLVVALGFVGCAAALLYAFDVTSAGFGLLPVVAVLMLVGWAIALVVIGLILRFGNGAEILTWGILFIAIALSGAFYPVEAVPAVLRPLSLALPSTHAFEAGRRLLDGEALAWGRLGVAGVELTVLMTAAVAFVLRMLRVFRARGYVTRFS
ncbi:MAG TPA: ABC transporter permease [Acidimicrobiales bacterium]|nr:ABC transporter permease [Acidimicrobiales bacterium]